MAVFQLCDLVETAVRVSFKDGAVMQIKYVQMKSEVEKRRMKNQVLITRTRVKIMQSRINNAES